MPVIKSQGYDADSLLAAVEGLVNPMAAWLRLGPGATSQASKSVRTLLQHMAKGMGAEGGSMPVKEDALRSLQAFKSGGPRYRTPEGEVAEETEALVKQFAEEWGGMARSTRPRPGDSLVQGDLVRQSVENEKRASRDKEVQMLKFLMNEAWLRNFQR